MLFLLIFCRADCLGECLVPTRQEAELEAFKEEKAAWLREKAHLIATLVRRAAWFLVCLLAIGTPHVGANVERHCRRHCWPALLTVVMSRVQRAKATEIAKLEEERVRTCS